MQIPLLYRYLKSQKQLTNYFTFKRCLARVSILMLPELARTAEALEAFFAGKQLGLALNIFMYK